MPELTPPSPNVGSNVNALLAQMIPSTGIGMRMHLVTLDVVSHAVLEARVAAQAELANRTAQYLHPKDKDFTDMDRKIMLDAHVREYRANYELLAGYEKLLEQRINIIRGLLNVRT